MRHYIIEIDFQAYAKRCKEFIRIAKTTPLTYEEAREISLAKVADICLTGVLFAITVHEISNSLKVSVDEQERK